MKTCFVICPLGDPKGPIRTRSDTLYETVILPTLKPLKYEVTRGDFVRDQKTIPESISYHIFHSHLVIADLSDCNANVFYELGKRHAWGKRCVHLSNDITDLPFDISHYRVLQYNLDDPENLDHVRKEIRLQVTEVENIPLQCPYPMKPEDIIEITGTTILVDRKEGTRDHYYLAESLARISCKRIFLMQRSSTLILGPELGWEAERIFYEALLEQIAKGAEFHHIVSMEGIDRHLSRPQSKFPNTKRALERLANSKGVVGIEGPGSFWGFKKIPEGGEIPDLKPDRQARTFLIEREEGNTEGVIVLDLGGMQSHFHIAGPKVTEYIDACRRFYDQCHYVTWDDLKQVPGLMNPNEKPNS